MSPTTNANAAPFTRTETLPFHQRPTPEQIAAAIPEWDREDDQPIRQIPAALLDAEDDVLAAQRERQAYLNAPELAQTEPRYSRVINANGDDIVQLGPTTTLYTRTLTVHETGEGEYADRIRLATAAEVALAGQQTDWLDLVDALGLAARPWIVEHVRSDVTYLEVDCGVLAGQYRLRVTVHGRHGSHTRWLAADTDLLLTLACWGGAVAHARVLLDEAWADAACPDSERADALYRR